MQLDRTEITIRQRSTSELFDLTLVVFRRHARRILVSAILFGGPIMLAIVASTSWMLDSESLLAAESAGAPVRVTRWRHAMHVLLVWYLVFPMASLPITLLLGKLIFLEQITTGQLLRALARSARRWLLVLGGMRLGLIGWLILLFLPRFDPFANPQELMLFFLLLPTVMLIRSVRPFAPEILVLEECPLRARQAWEIPYRRRVRSLHRFATGDNIGRGALLGVVLTLLGLSLAGNAMFVQGSATGNWSWNAWWDHVIVPGLFWLLGIYAAVFRFVAYLDTRIRTEGWEVELRMRAEAQRLAASQGPSLTPHRAAEGVAS
ncbi:MAG: hypothetical protein KatS3mg111_4013 [Pirellulaceae bacterium]|nr:MAG: hypothetical protein KatS3mg111_4013 [Pirellulaceae bacterium]